MPPKLSDCCRVCNKKDLNNQVMISCDSCSLWYHNQCQNLTKPEVNLVSKAEDRGVKWFCNTCRPSLMITTTDQATTTDEKLDKITLSIKVLNEKIDQQSNQVQTYDQSYSDALKVNAENLKKSVDANAQNIVKSQAMLQQSLDVTDAEARKVNAIIYGLPADNTKSVMAQLSDFMSKECFTQSVKPVTAFRLGNKEQQGNRSRPIKVKFTDEKSKWDFVKRVNSNMRKENIFCKLDTPKEHRDREYALRQQVKELKSSDTQTTYRIRDMSIQQKNNTSGEWVQVKPATKKTTNV